MGPPGFHGIWRSQNHIIQQSRNLVDTNWIAGLCYVIRPDCKSVEQRSCIFSVWKEPFICKLFLKLIFCSFLWFPCQLQVDRVADGNGSAVQADHIFDGVEELLPDSLFHRDVVGIGSDQHPVFTG